jgi:hypothetical protein
MDFADILKTRICVFISINKTSNIVVHFFADINTFLQYLLFCWFSISRTFRTACTNINNIMNTCSPFMPIF